MYIHDDPRAFAFTHESRDAIRPFNHHFILSFRGQPIGASTPLIRWKILLKDARDSARVHDFEEDSN